MNTSVRRIDLAAARVELPTGYIGKLEPTTICRAWNAKRSKYCGAAAGAGTSHPGVGRCKHHEGRAIQHGRTSTLMHERLGPLLEEFRAKPPAEAIQVWDELALARALLWDWATRFEAYSEALLAWHESFESNERARKPRKALDITTLMGLIDTISKLTDRVHGQAMAHAVRRDRVLTILEDIGAIINREVSNPAELARIEEAIREIRLR